MTTDVVGVLRRTELLRSLGLTYKELEDQGFLLVLTKIEVRYRSPARYDDLLTIDEALTQLGEADLRAARVTELRFFAGLQESEIAEEPAVVRVEPAVVGFEMDLVA